MSTLSWMSRVRAWFATKADPPSTGSAEGVWSGGGATLALVGTAVAEQAPPQNPADYGAPTPSEQMPPGPQTSKPRPERDPPPTTTTPLRAMDPLDPPWLQHLDESLGSVGRELHGHREATRAVMQAVTRLPDLTSGQTERIDRTNDLLQRQNALLESVLDSLSALAASSRTMEESSHRNLTAIGQLEASHRHVLRQYQTILLKSHRRLGRLIGLATVLATLALGGVGYLAYVALHAL